MTIALDASPHQLERGLIGLPASPSSPSAWTARKQTQTDAALEPIGMEAAWALCLRLRV